MTTLLRTDKDIEDIYRRYVDMLYRVAYSFMKNSADAEDMVQETFIRLLRSGTSFASEQHEKAWLIVTVSNLCKSALRSPWQRREALDAITEPPTVEDAPPDEALGRCWPCRRTTNCRSISITTRATPPPTLLGCWMWLPPPSAAA